MQRVERAGLKGIFEIAIKSLNGPPGGIFEDAGAPYCNVHHFVGRGSDIEYAGYRGRLASSGSDDDQPQALEAAGNLGKRRQDFERWGGFAETEIERDADAIDTLTASAVERD